jgi:lipoprotein NlpI
MAVLVGLGLVVILLDRIREGWGMTFLAVVLSAFFALFAGAMVYLIYLAASLDHSRWVAEPLPILFTLVFIPTVCLAFVIYQFCEIWRSSHAWLPLLPRIWPIPPSTRGRWAHRQGDFSRAIAEYTETIRINPGDPVAYTNRAEAYSAWRGYDRATHSYDLDRAKDNTTHAIADYSEAIRLQPSASRYQRRGDAHEYKACFNDDQWGYYDPAIADYTEAIRLQPSATLYDKRGAAFQAKGDIDHAIADFSEAIRFEPFARRYNIRGNAYDTKGEHDCAIADYTEAIKLDPEREWHIDSRGHANFHAANYAAAASDFSSVVRKKPGDAYAILWLYLAQARGGNPNARAELQTNAAKLKQPDWPYPAMELFLDRRTPEATIAAAGEANERCEAQFYIGQWHLMRGDRTRAIDALKVATDACDRDEDWIMHTGVRAELKRLGAGN